MLSGPLARSVPSAESASMAAAAYRIRLNELTLPTWTHSPAAHAARASTAAAGDSFQTVDPPTNRQSKSSQSHQFQT